MDSLDRLSSTYVGTGLVNRLPNGGTAPVMHPDTSKTSSVVANLMFLQLMSFLKSLDENLLLADKIAK